MPVVNESKYIKPRDLREHQLCFLFFLFHAEQHQEPSAPPKAISPFTATFKNSSAAIKSWTAYSAHSSSVSSILSIVTSRAAVSRNQQHIQSPEPTSKIQVRALHQQICQYRNAMSPPHNSFPGRESRRERQTQRSIMDSMNASRAELQGEGTRGRQSTRRAEVSTSASFLQTRARDSMSPTRRPRGGRDGSAFDGLGYRTYSPQPPKMRRGVHSPEDYTTSGRSHTKIQSTSFGSSGRGRHESPPARRYAPRSTTSGNLSFESSRHASTRKLTTRPSKIPSLDIGPPAVAVGYRTPSRKSSSTDFCVPSLSSHRSVTQHRVLPDSHNSFTTRDSSASRNALTRVQRSEYKPERESPRDALRRRWNPGCRTMLVDRSLLFQWRAFGSAVLSVITMWMGFRIGMSSSCGMRGRARPSEMRLGGQGGLNSRVSGNGFMGCRICGRAEDEWVRREEKIGREEE